MSVVSEWLRLLDPEIEFLALQEVGGTMNLLTREPGETRPLGPLDEYSFQDCELADFFVFGSSRVQSHLAQMILLSKDAVECVLDTFEGERVIGVQFVATASKVKRWIFSIHLPHSDNDEDTFAVALAELSTVCHRHQSGQVVILGDFNVERESHRAFLLDDVLGRFGYKTFRGGVATRFGRNGSSELDFACVSRKLNAMIRRIPQAARLIVHSQSRLDIGSDHERITLELALGDKIPRRARRRPNKGRCGRWSVGLNLNEHVSQLQTVFSEMSLVGKWEALKETQVACCYRTPTYKFKDSPQLKQMCKDRTQCQDPDTKLLLTRGILAKRRAEKIEWLRDLEERSSRGEAGAIRYLRGRSKVYNNMDGMARECGGVDEAARAIQEHFDLLFNPTVSDEHKQTVAEVMSALQLSSGEFAVKLFTKEEIDKGVARLKPGKSTGMSGVSSELLTAMWTIPQGQCILTDFLNDMLQSSEVPAEVHRAFVVLLPKVRDVLRPLDIRPICLVEVTNKLFSFLLLQRLVDSWPVPNCQFGAVSGGQVLDALAAAHWQTGAEAMRQRRSVWINADIQSAFDSLNHSTIAQYLQEHCPPHLSRETLQLLRIVCSPVMKFSWKGTDWETLQGQGVQQGHTHSPIIFAYIIGHYVQTEFERWRVGGSSSSTGDWGWLFIDDLLLHFDDWHTASTLTPLMQKALASLGLRLNLRKTELLGHEEALQEGRRLCLPEDHLLRQISWKTSTQYLRKPLRFLEVGESTFQLLFPSLKRAVYVGMESMKSVFKSLFWREAELAFKLVNRYVGSKWFWFGPLLIPIQTHVQEVQTLQVSVMTSVLKLFIPETVKRDAAMSLHRLRRRALLVFLGRNRQVSWAHIWRMRIWGYFGHVLRRHDTHPTKRILLGQDNLQRPQGGVANTPLRWIRSSVAKAFSVEPTVEQLLICAADREQWRIQGSQYIVAMGDSESHSHLAQSTWSHWQYSVLQLVPWLFPCSMVSVDGRTSLIWIDECEGFQQWDLEDVSFEDLWTFVTRVRMQSDAWVFMIHVSTEMYEAHAVMWGRLAEECVTNFHQIVLLDILDDVTMERVTQLALQSREL